jgi:flagellar hook-associated protein FlgK
MSDMLGISSNALGAYQRALSTVSNNIANVNTEGYSRQDVVLKDTAPSKSANNFFGTGVALEAVKRQFDAFAESNLRNSTSDLSSQKPMVEYTKRVMDIMGDKSVGLSSALDDFFAAANGLSADPASSVLRSTFLRSSEGLGSRFAELSGQLDLVGTETRQALESTTNQINTLTSQIALVNQNMAKSATLDGQSAEILDRRDLLLRQLSDLVRIKTSFATNGTVNVSLGNTVTQSVVVDGQKSRPVGIDKSVVGKTELLLDPYGKTESLAAASGGQLGGLQTFISQVLEPAQKNLNFLAKTVVTEANNIQSNGIDGYGQTGQNLFALDPSATNEAAGIHVALNDAMRVATAAQFRVSEANGNTSSTRASVRFTPGANPLASGISNPSLVNNPNPTAGVTIKVEGALVYSPVTTLSAGTKATFYLDDAKPGQQLQVLTRDGRQLLGQTLSETEKFQMLNPENGFVPNSTYSDAYLNQTGDKGYRQMSIFYGAKADVRYAQVFDKNGVVAPPQAQAAVLETGRIPDNAAGLQIAAGAIVLNGVSLPDLATQPATALSPNDVEAWINGGSTVTIEDANFSGLTASFGGVKLAIPRSGQNLDTTSMAALAASLQTELRAQDGTDYITVVLGSNNQDLQIADALGRSIADVTLTPNAGFKTGGKLTVASSLTSQTGVRAEVFSEIRVPTQQLDFSKHLKLNGQVVVGDFKDVNGLVDALNATTFPAGKGVKASVKDGELVISSLTQGESLVLNSDAVPGEGSANVLSLSPMTYNGQVRLTQVARDLHVPSTNIDYNKNLQINGVRIDTTGLMALPLADRPQAFADRINNPNLQPSPGVKASIGTYGDLVLSTTDASGTANISVGPGKNSDGSYEQNALGLEPLDYSVEDRLKQLPVNEPAKANIRLSFGSYGEPAHMGSPADLAKAGLRTGAYIEGGAQDDLLVFVTGQGKASVAASYSGAPLNVRDNLRSQSLVVTFTASDRYTITDAKTGTQLADRHYDPTVLEPVIDFEGLQLKLSHNPSLGDSFQVDGNQDGLGNNVNMLDMVDLAKKPVIGDKTIANSYIDQINNVGNLAQQANITQQALTVVNDQAVAARDKVSGVNLDEEAAALIRYQQAYQACAKALQISGQLFDAVVQIR